MGLRRKRPVHSMSLIIVQAVACLMLGCVPPPEPVTESPESASPNKERRHHNGEEGADSPRHNGEEDGANAPRRHEERREEPSRSADARNGAPENVLVVLNYVREHHEAPEGYEGGREFHNSGGRGDEKALPRRDNQGRPVTYQEWDVNRKVKGVNRGAERLITGSDDSAYYTTDHYRTFTKIR